MVFTHVLLFLHLVVAHVVDPITLQVKPSDSKFRNKEQLNPDSISLYVFLEQLITQSSGRDASSFSNELECHLDVDILWKHELGTPVYNVPLICDLYSDGKKEIVVATSNNYIEAIDSSGYKAFGWPFAFVESTFQASPLLYDKNGDGINEVVVTTQNAEVVFIDVYGIPIYGATLKVPPMKVKKDWYIGLDIPGIVANMHLNQYGRTLLELQEDNKQYLEYEMEEEEKINKTNKIKLNTGRKLNEIEKKETTTKTFEGLEGYLTDEGIESFDIFLPSETPATYVSHVRNQKDPLSSSFSSNIQASPDYVLIDPHVLATPVVVDLDKDGNEEIILPVSYYFDKDYYSDISHLKNLDVDVDISKYVASGICIFELKSGKLKQVINLDLTTDTTRFSSYIYGSPTVIDLDEDGNLEILVATGSGYIYKINHKGEDKRRNKYNETGELMGEGFPIMMDAIHTEVIVEDLNDDGKYEIIANDINGNVVCFDLNGKELWESRVSGYSAQAPVIGDVDGDGVLDVVVATTEGHVFAINGGNGQTLENFPVRLQGRVQSQPLLIHLHKDLAIPGLHIVVASNDGHVYLIDGRNSCFDKIDIGEASFSKILADDFISNGHIQLLLVTRSGNIYLLNTQIPFHPLKSWTSHNLRRNGYSNRFRYQGIQVLETTRSHRDIAGDSFQIQIEITDNRAGIQFPFYDVKIAYGGKKLLEKRYTLPGTYTETLDSPHQRISTSIQVQMVNEHLQLFEDQITLSFNVHFYRMLKWILVIPFALMTAILLFVKEIKSPLPLFL